MKVVVTLSIFMGMMLGCETLPKRPFNWCILNEGKCQYKDKTKDTHNVDGMWCTTAEERLAAETYLLIKEEELIDCQKKLQP